uniref:Uncharacterized protein n=1 Tax=Arion vulgaris TaxID=1028688 RepID=A0A0B7A7A6_9EUPU
MIDPILEFPLLLIVKVEPATLETEVIMLSGVKKMMMWYIDDDEVKHIKVTT